MAGFAPATKNTMLDAGIPTTVYVSLHTADPGTTGANEVSGGSPAYARVSATMAAAASGSKATSTATTHNVPTGTTVSYFGFWSAATAGTWYGGGALTASQAFSSQGTYTEAAGALSCSIS